MPKINLENFERRKRNHGGLREEEKIYNQYVHLEEGLTSLKKRNKYSFESIDGLGG